MSYSAPRHAAPKHARTGPRSGPPTAATESSGARAVDLGQGRHHAAAAVRTRSGLSRAAGIAALTAAVVAISGGGYALSEASSADVATAPTVASPVPSNVGRASPTPTLTAMRGAGTVALSPDTLAARQRAAAAATAATKAKERAAAAAKSSRSSDRQALPGGSPKAIAHALMANYGWGDEQFSCLVTMWNHESGWNPNAENPGSGAYGIPQSLPGSKMATYGSDWRSNPATQISWGLNYIKTRYKTPCGAWSFWQRGSWY